MLNSHKKWMKQAILEAFRSKGLSGINPPVGCVIVKDNIIITRGRTSVSGRPHAEENAINNIKDPKTLFNSIMYVTLEPCAHMNKQGFSCADLIIKSGISKIFISCFDPDKRTSGKGVSLLRNNNIEVFTTFMETEALSLYKGFFSRIINKKPYISLKIACSLDGKIALNNKKSKWITNDLSRSYSHFIRSQTDAILTSSATVIKDNSELTCRLNGLEHSSPIKILLDRQLSLTKDYKIFNNNYNNKLIIYYSRQAKNYETINTDRLSYVKVNSEFEDKFKYFDFIFNDLSNKGINNLLIECGSVINSLLISLNLVDELVIFRSGKIIGNDGVPFINNLGYEDIDQLANYNITSSRMLGEDTLEIRKLNYEGL